MNALRRHARLLAFALLAALTAYGVWAFATGDWRAALDAWSGRLSVLPWVLALAVLDVGLEAVAAMWVYESFGVRAFDARGAAACLSMRAGLLLPAQLTRVLRPDAFVRLGRGSARACLEAEAATFALDALSVVTLVAAALAWRVWPPASPLAAGVVVAAGLAAGAYLSRWLRDTRFALPEGFWRRRSSVGVVALEAGAWLAHGIAFWLLVRGLPGDPSATNAVLASALASVAGAGSGVPGGVGVTDGLLGASLRWMSVPIEHLAVVVLGFRLATFWLWIPVGWVALAFTRRSAAAAPLEVSPERP